MRCNKTNTKWFLPGKQGIVTLYRPDRPVASTSGKIDYIIHPIRRFKSSDSLKEGHMTWIIFDNFHVLKLIHVLFFTISLTLKEAVTAAEFGTR